MEPPTFCRLPSCVIRHIFTYLSTNSLYNLARSDERFEAIIRYHRSMWRLIDGREPPNDREKADYLMNLIHDGTYGLLLRGDDPQSVFVPRNLFNKIISSNIVVLALENQTIDAQQCPITCFPKQLEELSLKRSHVHNSPDFFRNSFDHLSRLRVLILDDCQWVTSASFMSVSKYPNLEIFSVYHCRNCDNSIAYLSLSGNWGFKTLKVFDARLTRLGNTLVRSLHKSDTLLALYFQNEDISYKLDFFLRRLALLKGARALDYNDEEDEFDVLNDSLHNEENAINYEPPESLEDRGLVDYLMTNGDRTPEPMPTSVLYRDPFNECTCRHGNTSRRGLIAPRNPADNNIPQPKPAKSKINNHGNNSQAKPDNVDDKSKKDNHSNTEQKKPPNNDNPPGDDDRRGGGGVMIEEVSAQVRKLQKLVSLTQDDPSRSRGLFDKRRNESPPMPGPLININNANGIQYRVHHESNQNVCIENMDEVVAKDNSERVRGGVSERTIHSIVVDAYQGQDHNIEDTDEENFEADLESSDKRFKQPHYKHRDGSENRAPRNIIRPEITVQIRSNSKGSSPYDLSEVPGLIRKRLMPPDEAPENKKQRLDDEEAGPSGINNANNGDEVILEEPEPEEQEDELRIIYMRPEPQVQIVNMQDQVITGKVPLRRLSLRGYRKITKTALEYIHRLDLEVLDLTYTNVNETAIMNFLNLHPGCRVLNEWFCNCPTNLHF